MKVLQISHHNHIVGGSDAVFFATCDMLEHAGHQVIRFCMDHPKNEPGPWNRFFPKGANTRHAPMGDTLRYFYNAQARRILGRLLDENGPVDVAHLHIYHGKQTPSILPLLRARGIPVVQTLHEYKLACPVYTMLRDGKPCDDCVTGSRFNAIRHRCKDGSRLRSSVMLAEMLTSRMLGDVRLVNRFLCVSDFQRGIMARAGIPETKLFTLHNFVDPPTGRLPERGNGYMLYFGRIEALKGLPTLIDAAKNTGLRLRIAGKGNWQEEMQRQINDCENIDYVGFHSGDALNRLIAGSRAVVVPSEWYENCPMSVLEAKALARPVIGADIGGIPELVRDGIDGFLFRPGDVGSLIRAFDRLKHADLSVLSTRARGDVSSRFSAGGHLGKLIGHYHAAQAERAPQIPEPVSECSPGQTPDRNII